MEALSKYPVTVKKEEEPQKNCGNSRHMKYRST